MFEAEFFAIQKCQKNNFESCAEELFLARRGSSNGLNRKFVLSPEVILNKQDLYVHILANFFAGMATRVAFYDDKSLFAFHSLKQELFNVQQLWVLMSQVFTIYSQFSIRLMDYEDVKCIYLFDNNCLVLDAVYATAIFCDRFGASTLQFEPGESFLAGGGNSLVAPKF